MTTDAREQEIQKLEAAFWNAMQDKDAPSAGRMTDDGCIIVGAQGVSAIDASVWLRRAGEWRCALHTESLAGDSFGRDRQAK